MSAATTQRRAGEGGFTLIETIVALALMGLVLSAVIWQASASGARCECRTPRRRRK